jgi:hypothetical protein
MLGRGGVVGRGQRVQGRPGPSFYSRHAPFKLVFLLRKKISRRSERNCKSYADGRISYRKGKKEINADNQTSIADS